MADKALSELIREFRKQTLTKEGKPFSLMDLSLEIGWANPSTLSRIENGDVKPARETIIKIGKALRLNVQDINVMLRTAGYAEYSAKPSEQYTKELVASVQSGFDTYAYPVLLLGFNGGIVYWNRFTELFFFGRNAAHEDIVSRYGNLSQVDILFNPNMRIQERIENWEEVSTILVENIYYDVTQATAQVVAPSYMQRWMSYPEFKRKWELCEKANNKNHVKYSIPFIYNQIELGRINLNVNTFLLYEDKRFVILQFNPTTKEDAEKMTKYLLEEEKR